MKRRREALAALAEELRTIYLFQSCSSLPLPRFFIMDAFLKSTAAQETIQRIAVAAASGTRPFLLFAELDPATDEHNLVLIPSLDTTEEWASEVVAAFPRETLCGVCHKKPLQTLALSQDWDSILLRMKVVAGFLCCGDKSCLDVSQLRANNRQGGLEHMRTRAILTTPKDMLKACVHCGNAREVVKTLVCGQCGKARYCNRECQKSHWPIHKKECH